MDGFRALIAAGATAVCCVVCAIWAFRSPSPSPPKKQQPIPSRCCGCASCGCRANTTFPSANGEMAVGGEMNKAPAPAPATTGASMMEQLVPEITTHALSYLDCTSLCRLSMTNSAMRRAANDDGAWKALYHKVLCCPALCCPANFTSILVAVSPATMIICLASHCFYVVLFCLYTEMLDHANGICRFAWRD